MGQHFLISRSLAERIVSVASIQNTETVFELGTGLGVLTGALCLKAGHVTSVEIDRRLAARARAALSKFENLRLECGDGLAVKACGGRSASATVSTSHCDIFASNLPYSHSRRAVEQLASAGFGRCIAMVQKEFALKLLAATKPPPSSEGRGNDRRAISVIAQYCFEIRIVMDVPAACFEPRPQVDSVVIEMIRKRTLDDAQILMINRIFSYRRKRLSSILRMVRDGDPGSGGAGGGDPTRLRVESAPAAPGTAADDYDRLRIDDLGIVDVVELAERLLGRRKMI